MKLLVTGASGFLGRNVIEAARQRNWDVVGLYWKSKTFLDFATKAGCQAVRHNLLRDQRVWDADVCIYLAGNSNHSRSVTSPVSDLRLNVEALQRFMTGFHGALVLLSSAAVYDSHTGLVSPATHMNPLFPYGISKLTAERYLGYWVHKDRISWSTILRLYYAYGPHDHEKRLIPKLLRAVTGGDGTFTVTAHEGSLIDPLYSADVAAALLAAARGRARNATLDLCSGRPLTIRQLVRDVAEHLGTTLRVKAQPRIEEWPVRFYSDPDELQLKLGLKRFLSLKEGVQHYARWIRAHTLPLETSA